MGILKNKRMIYLFLMLKLKIIIMKKMMWKCIKALELGGE
jgi:hypothetical protein